MSKYRNALPQLNGTNFISDGGLETTLIFHYGMNLPEFAAFPLLDSDDGKAVLRDYFESYAAIAESKGVGFILEGPTWRASRDWGQKLGYTESDLDRVNRAAMHLFHDIRNRRENEQTPIVVSGCIGPRGDGYVVDLKMTSKEAEDYHRAQVVSFADSGADMVSIITVNYAEEGIGVANAAQCLGLPAVIGFTVETDGCLPSGQPLQEAIEQADRESGDYPASLLSR